MSGCCSRSSSARGWPSPCRSICERKNGSKPPVQTRISSGAPPDGLERRARARRALMGGGAGQEHAVEAACRAACGTGRARRSRSRRPAGPDARAAGTSLRIRAPPLSNTQMSWKSIRRGRSKRRRPRGCGGAGRGAEATRAATSSSIGDCGQRRVGNGEIERAGVRPGRSPSSPLPSSSAARAGGFIRNAVDEAAAAGRQQPGHLGGVMQRLRMLEMGQHRDHADQVERRVREWQLRAHRSRVRHRDCRVRGAGRGGGSGHWDTAG